MDEVEGKWMGSDGVGGGQRIGGAGRESGKRQCKQDKVVQHLDTI